MATVHPARPPITPSIPLSLTLSLRSDVARCFQYNGSSSDHQPFKGERPPMQDSVRHKLRGPRGDPVQTRLRLKVQNRLQDWLQKVSQAQISLLLLLFTLRFCTTVHDEECRISYETSYKTVYDKKCSTTYVKSCHDVSIG